MDTDYEWKFSPNMTVVLHVNYQHLFDLSQKQHKKLKQQQLACYLFGINQSLGLFSKDKASSLPKLGIILKGNTYHTDEVNAQENLPSRLQRSAARFLPVHLPCPTG